MADDEILSKEKFLGRSFIFEALDEQNKRDLAAFAHMKRYAAGDVIFSVGGPGQSMMAIAEGTVRVDMVTPGGRDVTLTKLSSGDVFGEIALLDGGKRSANVRAMTNCTLVVL